VGGGKVAVTEKKLIKKGAEASLYIAEWHGKRVVIKERLPKRYRPEQLDQTIRRYRTVHEPQLMHEAKRAGVPTPMIFVVDVENASITMEYVEGIQVKPLIDSLCDADREELCIHIGEAVGKLHEHGIVHGDLTTSNMILNPDGRIVLVDFGLGDKSAEMEAQGVDLHLLKRALQSTHFQHAHDCFDAVLKGYASVRGAYVEAEVCEKVREIEKRGRYVAERQTGA
jgi:TP53 regulating kinase and related kinases